MTKRLACHYSVLRYCPYPETDEFVNVGILLACPATGYLNFRRMRTRAARVSDFFPELDPALFKAVVESCEGAFGQFRNLATNDQLLADFEVRRHRDLFAHLVRPRESILTYSEPRIILSEAPDDTLHELFQTYVERSFAKTTEYKETVMAKRLERLLRNHSLMGAFKSNARVGDERFHVTFSLARPSAENGRPALRAIRALHLDKAEPTDLFQHADGWLNNVRRLREFGTQPQNMLFVLTPPADLATASGAAYQRVLEDYKNAEIPVVTESASDAVLAFAQAE